MKGRTLPTHGVCGGANADGVRRHTPGPGGSVGNEEVTPIGVRRSSPVRRLIMFVAAAKPTACPVVLGVPSGINASAEVYGSYPPSIDTTASYIAEET